MKEWQSESFYNKWLRSQAEESVKDRSMLTICMQEPQELQSVLETIQKFVKVMNTGKVKIEVCPGEINLRVSDSKEMSI